MQKYFLSFGSLFSSVILWAAPPSVVEVQKVGDGLGYQAKVTALVTQYTTRTINQGGVIVTESVPVQVPVTKTIVSKVSTKEGDAKDLSGKALTKDQIEKLVKPGAKIALVDPGTKLTADEIKKLQDDKVEVVFERPASAKEPEKKDPVKEPAKDLPPGPPQVIQPTFKDDKVIITQKVPGEETYATVTKLSLTGGEIVNRLGKTSLKKEVDLKLELKLADLEVLLPNGRNADKDAIKILLDGSTRVAYFPFKTKFDTDFLKDKGCELIIIEKKPSASGLSTVPPKQSFQMKVEAGQLTMTSYIIQQVTKVRTVQRLIGGRQLNVSETFTEQSPFPIVVRLAEKDYTFSTTDGKELAWDKVKELLAKEEEVWVLGPNEKLDPATVSPKAKLVIQEKK